MSSPVVLCIEDDEAVRQVQTVVLQKAGYRVLEAATAAEALQLLAAQNVDVVVADNMPGATAGESLLAELKQRKPEVPILLCTGLLEPPLEARFADAFLSKPGGTQALLEHVAALLARSRHRKKPH